MTDRVQSRMASHSYSKWVYLVCLILAAALLLFAIITGKSFIWAYLCVAVLFLFACRPTSALHTFIVENNSLPKTVCSILVALVTIAACVLPMDRLPIWNGEIPDHRNQYELMAEAILDGRIDFDYNDDDALSQLENPYDPEERQAAGVYYHWDHAYYNGHYYMYFGIVPVFLVFLPYRILTGTALTTYHATQIFAAVAILGIFVLFHLLSKLFFKKLPYSVYLSLSVAFSVMSVWYSIAQPALYCTAITAAIALEIWSLYFFVRAVYKEQNENRQIVFAAIGALFGALVFGCRPPIAIANILVVPMLIVFLKQRKFTLKLLGKLTLAALPYVIIAAALMLYNYVRFDNPFEFGQAYQLTVTDQSDYGVVLNRETILRLINNTLSNFFGITDVSATFPYLNTAGVFFNFPILILCAGIFKTSVFKNMQQKKLVPLIIGFIVTVLAITAMDILWSPYLLERYHMDVYFLMGICCFIIIGLWNNTCTFKRRAVFSSVTVILSAVTVVSSFLFYVYNVGVYYPDKITVIANILRL